ncbi:MAG: hypothetical protein CME60_00280 [Halobacteriovoraceae bacterium]|nr:hypothetical protein [Halobacteriovoraceae bacterium]
MHTESTCIVVVTFNRKELLIVNIASLLKQNKNAEKILIIDNNSNDGTYDLLKEKFLDLENIEYHNTGANLGGAGGFRFGMELAYSRGYEWIWIMDDDVATTPNALQTLYSYKDISPFIHPGKYFEDGTKFHWEGFFDPNTTLMHWRKRKSQFEESDYVNVNYGCFEGALIHRKVIDKIGLPDDRFFIHNDDLLYGLLASQFFPVIYIKEHCLTKLINKKAFKKFLFLKNESFSPFATYFILRNQFLLKEILIEKLPYTNEKLLNFFTFLKIVKMFLEVTLFERSWAHFKMFRLALKHGRSRNYQGHKEFIN